MIATWMIYTTVVALLLYAAAMGTEYVARALRLPTRFVWLLAMTAVVGLSASALLGGRRASRTTTAAVTRSRSTVSNVDVALDTTDLSAASPSSESAGARLRAIARSVVGSVARINSSAFDRWNVGLIVAWVASSALGIAWLVLSLLRLRRLARRLIVDKVANEEVLISDDLGPALLGVMRPRIVVPKWVLELPVGEQGIIVAHERQHAAAFDPALAWASFCIVAIQPWNAGLWMLLARLRLAVEVDCDGRVLAADEGRVAMHRYGRLLVAMYERTSGLSTQLAFATRPSNLELRIRRITSRPRIYTTAFGVSAIVALVCATAAWETAAPKRVVPLASPVTPATTARASAPSVRRVPSGDSAVVGRPKSQISVATRKRAVVDSSAPVPRMVPVVPDTPLVRIPMAPIDTPPRDTAGKSPARIIGQFQAVGVSTEALFEMLFEGIPLDKARADRAMALLDSLEATQTAQVAEITRRVVETRPQRQLLQAQLDSSLLAVPTNAADVEIVRSRLPQTTDGVGRSGGGGRGAGPGTANVGGGRGRGPQANPGDVVDLLFSRYFDGIALSPGQDAAAHAALVKWHEGTQALLPRVEPRILTIRRNPTLIGMQPASDSAFLALVSSDADRATLQSRINAFLPPSRPPN